MNKPKITIIDTGCANLSSVKLAFDRLGVDTTVSFDPDDIRKADKLILPGVGTAVAAMQMLRERRLVDLIREARQPLLGICLGMQMLATLSEEKMNSGENVPCLDLVKARVGLMQTGNFTGTQFHPEKSGATGARLLTNFVEM